MRQKNQVLLPLSAIATTTLLTLGIIASGANHNPPNVTPNPTPTPTNTSHTPTGNHQGVFTIHYDSQRSGVNPNESQLTPANVGPGQFGKLTAFSTTAYTVAQPLYVTNVNVNYAGTLKDVLYVASEDDTLTAFDASGATTTPLWKDTFGTALAATDVPVAGGCPDIAPLGVASIARTVTPAPVQGQPGTTWGLTGTPVIDPTTETLYVVSMTKDTTKNPVVFATQLHAIDINTGAEKFGGPKAITGNNFDVTGQPINNQREGLVLTPDGTLVIAFSSNCDTSPYAGTVFTYNATSLQQISEYQSSSNISNPTDGQTGLGGAGIWSLGTGPAVDTSGNVFLATGNGVFDCDPNQSHGNNACQNFGCSVLKLGTSGGVLTQNDYYTPADQANMNTIQVDLDLGSGGMTLIPDQVDQNGNPVLDQNGNPLQLVVGAGKSGQVYVVNRNSMGKYSDQDFTFQNLLSNGGQTFNLNGQPYAQNGVYFSITDGLFGTPTYYNGRVYFAPVGDSIKAFQLQGGKFVPPAGTQAGLMAPVDQTDWIFGWPGGTPVISANCGGTLANCPAAEANGSANAILWYLDNSRGNAYAPNSVEATLYAFDAKQMGYTPGAPNNGLLYSSDLSARDANNNPVPNANDVAGAAVKHVQPTVYNGHVYVATRTEIDMYGQTGNAPIVAPTPLPVAVTQAATGVDITLNYDSATSVSTGNCPANLSLPNQFNFYIQICGGDAPQPACGSATQVSYLDKFVNVPYEAAAPIMYPVPLDASASSGVQGSSTTVPSYEIFAGVNPITIPGLVITPTLVLENATPFQVTTGFASQNLNFYLNCTP